MYDMNHVYIPFPKGPRASIEFRERAGSRVFRLRREALDAIGGAWTNLDADGEILGRVRRNHADIEVDAPDWDVVLQPDLSLARQQAAREAIRLFEQIERLDRTARGRKGGAA